MTESAVDLLGAEKEAGQEVDGAVCQSAKPPPRQPLALRSAARASRLEGRGAVRGAAAIALLSSLA
jgi:hypothetical protein